MPMQPLRLVATLEGNARKEIDALVAAVEQGNARMNAAATGSANVQKRVAQDKATTIAASERDLLREVQRAALARASAENDLFARQRLTLKAQTDYRLAVYRENAAMTEQILKTHADKMAAIASRESGFSNTPFQKMLTQQNVANQQTGAFVAMMAKMGMSSKQAGQAVQQAGFQVGDFATQVASGQGFLRPFIQQGTQLVSMFGPWGAAIGAAGAVLGAFAVYALNAKDSVGRLTQAIKEADYSRLGNEIQALSSAERILIDVQTQGVRQFDSYGLAALSAQSGVESATRAINENKAALTAIFGSIEAASAAYERLQSQTVKGLRVQAQVSGLKAGDETVGSAKQVQELQNKERIEELKRGFDRERIEVQAWEQKKSKDGETVYETEKQLAERQAKEIARINRDEKESITLQEKVGANEVLKVQRDFGKKSADEAKRTSDKIRATALADQQEAHRQEAARAQFGQKQIDAMAALQVRVAEIAANGNEEELMRIRQDGETRLAEQQFNLDMTAEQYKAHLAYMTELAATHDAEKAKYAKSETTRMKMQSLAMGGMALETASNIAQAGAIIGGQSKALFAVTQALALATIGVKTAEAVVTDNANPLTWWKVPYDIALGASQAAVVAATTVKGFEVGGYTGSGPRGEVAGVVHRDEYVIPSPAVRSMGGPGGVERALSGGGSGISIGSMPITVTLTSGSPAEAERAGRLVGDSIFSRLREHQKRTRFAEAWGVPR